MGEVGIRALKQNASEVVARAVGGEVLTVTDRGRPVALLSGLRGGAIDRLAARGARMPQADIKEFVSPQLPDGLSQVVEDMREEERY
ncbi:type II toxin-antitoxin system Phd/YefM family antitoxin [Ancrocorticia populi]|uniref:Type II toxin-antitoxin system prevent-host-death family antitoxin n=1 Tax=Ancrocorticia populi TaxID=2175228 RepID=A0A2V1K5F1_9ACTO|nr:type II toxin-antitoxin system prevent-host-death family antitoxin [Ancrocorticia populi]PWF26532.1 type II toxin-antitoxin system prevent-host-death family antitoxin [Ancrocorticia populi]